MRIYSKRKILEQRLSKSYIFIFQTLICIESKDVLRWYFSTPSLSGEGDCIDPPP